MIKELLKKDAVILGSLFAAGIVAHFALYVDWGFERLWVWPDQRLFWNASALHYIFGIALGLMVTLRDEVTRTQEFLWHRPVSRKLVFGTRTLTGIGIMLCWLVLSLWAEWLIEGWGNPNKLIAEGSRAWTYLAYGTVTFSSFAAACFAATWPGHWILRFTLGATPAVLILVACFGEPIPARPQDHPTALALSQFLASVLLLYAAWRNEVAGRDPDHPIPGPALRWSVSIAALAACVLWSLGVAEVQGEYGNSARRWYPEIARSTDGSYYLRGLNPETWPDVYEHMVFDSQHRVVGPAPELDDEQPLPWSPHRSLRAGTLDLHPPLSRGLIEVGRTNFYVRCFLDLDDGQAFVVTISGRGRPEHQPSRRSLGKGTGGKRFSPRARALGNTWDQLAMVWDQDGIWAYDLNSAADHFHHVPLPGGDRVVNWAMQSEVEGTWTTHQDDTRLLVLGEKATYAWTGTEFVRAEPSRLPLWSRPRVEAVVARMDPFTFTAEVHGSGGQTVFNHHYALHTWREKLPATVVFLGSLLRMPVLQVQSFLAPQGRFSFHRSATTDPLLAGHRRFWLLGSNLLLAAVLVVLAVGRLRRLGAPRGRVLCWSMAVAAGGLPLFLYCRLVETDRAWRRVAILKPEELPSMWIRSA